MPPTAVEAIEVIEAADAEQTKQALEDAVAEVEKVGRRHDLSFDPAAAAR